MKNSRERERTAMNSKRKSFIRGSPDRTGASPFFAPREIPLTLSDLLSSPEDRWRVRRILVLLKANFAFCRRGQLFQTSANIFRQEIPGQLALGGKAIRKTWESSCVQTSLALARGRETRPEVVLMLCNSYFYCELLSLFVFGNNSEIVQRELSIRNNCFFFYGTNIKLCRKRMKKCSNTHCVKKRIVTQINALRLIAKNSSGKRTQNKAEM